MFDIGSVELLIIGVVAIIVVGPKDLPGLLRRVGGWVAKARKMAGEFKTHFDEVADQEEFREIRKSFDSAKEFSPTHQIKKAMSPFEDAGNTIKESIGDVVESSSSATPAAKDASAAKKAPKKAPKKKAAPKAKKTKTAAAKKSPGKSTGKKPAKVAEKAGA